MATAKRFEDMRIWQEANSLVDFVYGLTRQKEMSSDYTMKDQIRRASLSVMLNIAEGFERGSNKEFTQFLFTAKGSCGETRSLLHVALKQNYISPEQFKNGYDSCVTLSRRIAALIGYMKESAMKGPKYSPPGQSESQSKISEPMDSLYEVPTDVEL